MKLPPAPVLTAGSVTVPPVPVRVTVIEDGAGAGPLARVSLPVSVT